MWPFKRRKQLTWRDFEDPEATARKRKLCLRIKKIAHEHTQDICPPGRYNTHAVIVPYRDMMLIWDLADRIYEES